MSLERTLRSSSPFSINFFFLVDSFRYSLPGSPLLSVERVEKMPINLGAGDPSSGRIFLTFPSLAYFLP